MPADPDTTAARLATDYSASADAYSRLWAPVIRQYSLQLLKELPLPAARRILDLGCGTGALLADIHRAAPAARVVGVDRAEGMARVANAMELAPVAVMDAQRLALRDSFFDVVFCAFVLFHVPDPLGGLKEIRRVMAPAGCAGVALWGDDPGLPGRDIWSEELDRAGAPPDTRPATDDSLMNTAEKLTALLESAGLQSRVWSTYFSRQWSLDDLLALQLGCGVSSRRIRGLSAAGRDECRSRAQARLAELTPQQLNFRPEVLFAIARHPDAERSK